MDTETVPTKGKNPLAIVLIIVLALVVLIGIAVAVVYLYNSRYKNQNNDQATESTTITPILEDISTWTVYTKAGEYSIKVPPILISPGNQTELGETNSFSSSGDYGVDARGNEAAPQDPSLLSTIWSEANSQNYTAKTAVEAQKANIVSFPTNNLQTTKENAVTINNNAGYQGVWSYTDQNTQLSHVYAVVATVKNNKVYYISLTVSGSTLAIAQKGWADNSYIFDKMISAFIFL